MGMQRRETGLPVATFQKMFAYCVVCGMGSRVIALLGGAVTDFLPFSGERSGWLITRSENKKAVREA
jgi:hypothetical protein